MIVDKPPWVAHGGDTSSALCQPGSEISSVLFSGDVVLLRPGAPIFSVDVDPTGQRMATAGADNKVRIWAMGPILSSRLEGDPQAPKVLATLSEHFQAVNVARFCPGNGKLLASGSDDKLVIIYQLQPGAGKAVFGSKDAPSVENWRTVHTMRGHNLNIADLAWAPDASLLASASLDNLVIVWDPATGRQVQILKGHEGHVKGLAWDPAGVYLATQGEYDGVFIWRVEDWSLVARISEPLGDLRHAASSTFHTRLCWSPDGQVLAVGNAYVKPAHMAPMIQRNVWTAPQQFCGHKGPVSVTRFNPRHFKPRTQHPSGAAEAGAGGGGTSDPSDDVAVLICALGSADKSFTVWSYNESTPVLIGKRFFKGQVMDLAWTPDGYTLIAASYDGTVAVCRIEERELEPDDTAGVNNVFIGPVLPESKTQELWRELYGERRAKGRALVADAQLLALEQAPLDTALHSTVATAKGAAAPAGGVSASMMSAATAVQGGAAGTSAGQAVPLPKGALRPEAMMARLSSRLGPGGGPSVAGAGASAGAGPSSNGAPAATQEQVAPPPPAQQQTQPGQRKRVAPTPVGGTEAAGAGAPAGTGKATAGVGGTPARAGAAGRAAAAEAGQPPPAKRQALAPIQPSAQQQPLLASGGAGTGLVGAAGTGKPEGGWAALQGTGAAVPSLFPTPGVMNLLNTRLGSRPAPDAVQLLGGLPDGTMASEIITLEAQNGGRDHRGAPQARLQCSAVGAGTGNIQALWSDVVQGQVVSVAGSLSFSAASTNTGDLLLYSPAGRRLFPPIRLGCSAVAMATDRNTKLLVLCADARLRIWDVQLGTSLLDVSAAPLLSEQGAQGTVPAVRLTSAGAPILVFRSTHAYTWHPGMAVWVRIADDSAPASQYHSAYSASQGDLGRAQAELAAARRPADVFAAAALPADAQRRAARSHLESNLASALALQSPQEWQRWLLTYVRQLAQDEDEGRLREVIDDLLGPLRWAPGTHDRGDHTEPGRGWVPTVLGMDKRRVLRDVVLPGLLKYRTPGNQRLAQEALDLLREAEAFVASAGGSGGSLLANGTGRDREGGADVPRRPMNAGGGLRHGEQGDAGMGYLPHQHGTGVGVMG